MRPRKLLGGKLLGGSWATSGELSAVYVTSPLAWVDSLTVRTARYVLCRGVCCVSCALCTASASAVVIGTGAGGGENGAYFLRNEDSNVSGLVSLSRCWTSGVGSSFHWSWMLSCLRDPVTESRAWSVLDRVVITSCGLFERVRCANIVANASSVMARGKFIVRDMGRWREKNADAAISAEKIINPLTLIHKHYIYLRVGEIWLVLGTLGKL